MRLLTALAQQAAWPSSRARLHGPLGGRTGELATLCGRAHDAGRARYHTIQQTIVQEASAISGTPHVTLLLRTPHPPSPGGGAGWWPHAVGAEPAPGPPPRGHGGRHRPAAIRDETYLGLPIKIRDTIGRAVLQDRHAPPLLGRGNWRDLGSFADHAAIALDNAGSTRTSRAPSATCAS